MASGPITSWQIDGETMETVTDFIFGDLVNETEKGTDHRKMSGEQWPEKLEVMGGKRKSFLV